YSRDWSSDVCSSDLVPHPLRLGQPGADLGQLLKVGAQLGPLAGGVLQEELGGTLVALMDPVQEFHHPPDARLPLLIHVAAAVDHHVGGAVSFGDLRSEEH